MGGVFSALSSPASHSLGRQSLDFVVGPTILKQSDRALHLMHLLFEIAEHLEELPGFRLWEKCH